MVEFKDISKWEEHEYLGTGGTRDKVVVESPNDNCLYYFKTSLIKKEKNYIYEFWSEIIASEIGTFLGFDVLKYNVAAKDHKTLGCLSKLMIDTTFEQLDEGYKWIKRYQIEYNTDDRNSYTFQLINETLKNLFPNEKFIEKLISTIVFDCIIGNEDRHQENWGIIVSRKESTNKIKSFFSKKTLIPESTYRFAPIYDSGSSLGRELREEKINQMLTDSIQLNAYINRGQSEIHWQGEYGKQKHFSLIDKIANTEYKYVINSEINRIKEKYDRDKIIEIISHIDDCVPEAYRTKKIPQKRKELLIKLITLRIERLLSYNYE